MQVALCLCTGSAEARGRNADRNSLDTACKETHRRLCCKLQLVLDVQHGLLYLMTHCRRRQQALAVLDGKLLIDVQLSLRHSSSSSSNSSGSCTLRLDLQGLSIASLLTHAKAVAPRNQHAVAQSRPHHNSVLCVRAGARRAPKAPHAETRVFVAGKLDQTRAFVDTKLAVPAAASQHVPCPLPVTERPEGPGWAGRQGQPP